MSEVFASILRHVLACGVGVGFVAMLAFAIRLVVSRDAVLRGLGIARLPEFAVKADVAAGRLISLFEDQVHSELQIQALFPLTQRMPAKTRSLLDFLTQRLAIAEGRSHAASTVPATSIEDGGSCLEVAGAVRLEGSAVVKPARRASRG